MHLNIIKAIYDKPTVNIILSGKRFKALCLSSATGKDANIHNYDNIVVEKS